MFRRTKTAERLQTQTHFLLIFGLGVAFSAIVQAALFAQEVAKTINDAAMWPEIEKSRGDAIWLIVRFERKTQGAKAHKRAQRRLQNSA
mgnify:CR=1 FL=1